MCSSSLSFRYFTYDFLLRHGYDADDLRGSDSLAAAMRHYWTRFSVVYDVEPESGFESFWWDRLDGWLPVSLLPR